ncbi:MAG: outer membrane beta-barrel protein [Bacteriovoracaceae bacterium]|nr:outer membrane beta-barrel protein [Bacteriovoracaceae bacterium]
MLFTFNLKKTLVPVMIFMAGTSFVFSADKTPNKKEETNKNEPRAIRAEPRIPSAVKVHSLGIGVGQTFLRGKWDDLGEDKITWDLLYTYAASHSFDFIADFHSTKHAHRQQWVRTTGLGLGIKAKIYQFDAFAPFATGGLGFYEPKTKRYVNGVLTESESKVSFGWHFGVGAELRLNRHFTTGILAKLHNPFDVKQEIGPEVEGSYSKLMITGMYSF